MALTLAVASILLSPGFFVVVTIDATLLTETFTTCAKGATQAPPTTIKSWFKTNSVAAHVIV